MSHKCPICGFTATTLVQGEIKGDVKTNVLRCSECVLDFLETWDDIELTKSFYTSDNYVFTHNISKESNIPLKYDEYEERYQLIKPYLSKDKTLLEIGCGDGKFLRKVRDEVGMAEGIELSSPQVRRLREEGFVCYDVMIDEMSPPRQYDIVCLFALLEHVPRVTQFLEKLKKYIHEKSHLFIEVPNLNDSLISGFDIQEFRTFYYRPVHLYYFTPMSLGKLLMKCGFVEYTLHTTQQASITNHFHWMHQRTGQPNANYMTAVVPPVPFLNKVPIKEVFERVDNYYRQLLEQNDMGDLLVAHIKPKISNLWRC